MHAPTPAPIASDDALAPGTRLGRYELLRRLAVGGMAELYLARATGIGGFNKLFALKRILPQYARSSDFVAMFLDEARLAARIQHANVAQVYDIGRNEHGLYFTMEYVAGEDIRAIMNAALRRDGELPLEHALSIAIGAAAGLHAAHELVDDRGTLIGLVHRDVSPSNVLVSYAGCVKLIDFGVAKAAGRRTETRVGTLKGKLSYMSPEQCAGRSIDRRSDVFALGVVLYEMTTGLRLYRAEADYELMKRIVEEDAPAPSSRRPDYPRDLEAIVLRALRRDPAERYASAQALQLDLERFARRHHVHTSSAQLAAYLRELFPSRNGEPRAVGGRVVRMATGTPHVDATPTGGVRAASWPGGSVAPGGGAANDGAEVVIDMDVEPSGRAGRAATWMFEADAPAPGPGAGRDPGTSSAPHAPRELPLAAPPTSPSIPSSPALGASLQAPSSPSISASFPAFASSPSISSPYASLQSSRAISSPSASIESSPSVASWPGLAAPRGGAWRRAGILIAVAAVAAAVTAAVVGMATRPAATTRVAAPAPAAAPAPRPAPAAAATAPALGSTGLPAAAPSAAVPGVAEGAAAAPAPTMAVAPTTAPAAAPAAPAPPPAATAAPRVAPPVAEAPAPAHLHHHHAHHAAKPAPVRHLARSAVTWDPNSALPPP